MGGVGVMGDLRRICGECGGGSATAKPRKIKGFQGSNIPPVLVGKMRLFRFEPVLVVNLIIVNLCNSRIRQQDIALHPVDITDRRVNKT